MKTFLQSTIERIDQAGKYLEVSKDELEKLKKPQNVLEQDLQVRLENGEQKEFAAFRVQHNDALGPFKGGIRFHPQVDLEEVNALALLMSLKNSAANLPYGGAKGGVVVEPKKLSTREIELLSRAYARSFGRHLGPNKDIPAPDVNTDAQTMAWMVDEYSQLHRAHFPASFTGKPLLLGGSHGRNIATSFGGAVVLGQWLVQDQRFKGKQPEDITVAIQGFGNVGANAAKLLFDRGHKIVAISDSEGAIYCQDGLPITEIMEIQERARFANKQQKTKNKLQDIVSKYEYISNDQLLGLDVDILVPAAIENQIASNNVSTIKAKVILELANGPIAFEAENSLKKNQVTVLPDIISNAGGVVGSYFEWVQNRTGEQWDRKIVMDKIEKKMKDAFVTTVEAAKEHKVDLRMGAYIYSMGKLIKAMRMRGRV